MVTGVLLLHGFTGGPYEVEPLTNYIKEHTDWIVETPTFTGHGNVNELSLKGCKAEHWLMDAEIAYRNLSKKVDEVVVIGFSMGGLIAIYLAKRYKVQKLVLLSAAMKYIAPIQLLKDLKNVVKDAMKGYLLNNEFFKLYEGKIKNVPLRAVVQFIRVVRIIKPFLSSIKVPTFVVQGQCDEIVPWNTAKALYTKIIAKEKYLYYSPKGKHFICYSDDCDKWFPKIIDFIQINS